MSDKCKHGRSICPCKITDKKINQKIIDLIMFDEEKEKNMSRYEQVFYTNLCYWIAPNGVLYHITYGSHSAFFDHFIKNNNPKKWIKFDGKKAYRHKGTDFSFLMKQKEALFTIATMLECEIEKLMSGFTWDVKDYTNGID